MAKDKINEVKREMEEIKKHIGFTWLCIKLTILIEAYSYKITISLKGQI